MEKTYHERVLEYARDKKRFTCRDIVEDLSIQSLKVKSILLGLENNGFVKLGKNRTWRFTGE